MKSLVLISVGLVPLLVCANAFASEPKRIRLCAGYIKRIECQGGLKFFSLGDPSLISAQAPSSPLGCVLYLRPLKKSGRTNLELETSIRRSSAILEITDAQTSGTNCAEKGQVL